MERNRRDENHEMGGRTSFLPKKEQGRRIRMIKVKTGAMRE